jgi:hypothetical protein
MVERRLRGFIASDLCFAFCLLIVEEGCDRCFPEDSAAGNARASLLMAHLVAVIPVGPRSLSIGPSMPEFRHHVPLAELGPNRVKCE